MRARQLFDDLAREELRVEEAGAKLEALYDELRAKDPRLPAPQPGVITKRHLARIVAETGPLDDFDSWRALMRYAGYNLMERQSGTNTAAHLESTELPVRLEAPQPVST